MRISYSLTKHQNISAVLILIIMLLLFFSKPIINIRTQYHSPANLGQFFPLTHAGYEQTNTSLNDIFLQMHPWAIFNDRSVRQGELPLWNPYNGLGAPFMANFISAVFSPYNLPFYLFDFGVASILASFLKLFACGFFTFLFLRSFSISYWPALIGATIFMFSGYNLFFLQWPQSSISPTIPAAFYFIRKLTQNKHVQTTALWGLMLSLAAGIMAGHPEAFFAALLMIGIYTLHQLYVSHLAWDITKHKTGLLLTVGILAALFTAIQLLPFFEYAILSNAFAERHGEGGGSFLDASLWPLWILPDLLGNPSLPLYFFRGHLPGGFTYVEENSLYVSAIGLVLAIIGLKKFKANSEVRFFALFALVYLIYSYKPINILFLIHLIPGLSYLPLFASSPTYTFALACLAAYGLESLLSDSARRHWRAIGVGVLGAALLGITLIAARNLLNTHYSGEIEARWREAWNNGGLARQILFGGLFVVGLSLLIVSQLIKTKLVQNLLMIGLLIATFLATGFFHRNFFPLSQNTKVYPVTPAMQKRQKTVKSDTLAILCKGDNTPGLFPDTNMMYNLRMPSQYEVLYTPFFPKLLDQFFDTAKTKRNMVYAYCLQRYSLKGFQVMSMPYALIHDDFAKDIPSADYESKIEIIPSFSLYKFKNVPARYYVVNQAEYVDDNTALKKLADSAFNPFTKTLISNHETDTKNNATLPTQPSTATVTVVQELNNQVTLAVDSQTTGWLVISTSYYPGWRAWVNGQETSVLRANYAFNAIPIKAGQSQILFKYDPISVKLGWALSAVGLLGMIGLTIYIRRKQARQ